MAGIPLLIINDKSVVNWWNILHLCIHEDGTSTLAFVDNDSITLTVEETKAFVAFVRNHGDTLRVNDAEIESESPAGNAGDRWAELTGNGGDA